MSEISPAGPRSSLRALSATIGWWVLLSVRRRDPAAPSRIWPRGARPRGRCWQSSMRQSSMRHAQHALQQVDWGGCRHHLGQTVVGCSYSRGAIRQQCPAGGCGAAVARCAQLSVATPCGPTPAPALPAVAGKAGTSCPTAKKFLTCVTPQWTMPNMANVILNSNTPALTVLDFPGNVDLRAILPWNDGVTL